MNFNSPEFLFFLPFVVIACAGIGRHARTRNVFLLAASYYFYMSWDWRYAGLIAFSTVIDYVVGLAMAREQRDGARKLLLIVSLVTNLGLLALFKYFNFFVDLAQDAVGPLGIDISSWHVRLLLPVGISFYTFQTLSYTIDLYRRQLEPERDFIRFALFVSFFPQLVAGPIVRASEFLPQLRAGPDTSPGRVADGLTRVFRGLFKKVVIADMLVALGVDAIFADPTSFSSVDLLMGLYGYAFVIYCDFSGYSDIAIGSARMLGFKLPVNFNRPYLSQNLREFWTRWHISLSSWLRDYLYIPLGGNRGTSLRVRSNLMTTMLLGGLWHGAALNFVLWGAWHGILLMFGRAGPRADAEVGGWRLVGRQVRCFHLVVVSWLLFRVTSMTNFIEYVQGLASLRGGTRLSALFYAILALAVFLHAVPQGFLARTSERVRALPAPVQGALYAGLILLFLAVTMQAPAFIYFQF